MNADVIERFLDTRVLLTWSDPDGAHGAAEAYLTNVIGEEAISDEGDRFHIPSITSIQTAASKGGN